MKVLIAVKKYMEADGGRKVAMDELKAFKAVCSDEDWAGFAVELTELLGEPVTV